ncbi:hypothetical protein [Mariniflexile sp. HMF6888]|uniref:hypothetical protein n=1 Tax=Mariniflexile sp. HMF6888 TaxID=3373086 RepID=UPI00379CD5CC
MEGNKIPIESPQGCLYPYPPTYYYNYPFDESFTHDNCVCVAVTRFENTYTGFALIGFKVEFQKLVTDDTYRDKLYINGFEAIGLALIKTTEEKSEAIINDIKCNSNFYVENALDLI